MHLTTKYCDVGYVFIWIVFLCHVGGSDMFVGEYGCYRDMFFGFFRTHHVVNLERVKTQWKYLN